MANLVYLLIAVILCVKVTEIQSAKILGVFPWPSISHQVVFRPLTQELARRGHEVTVVTTDPAFPKGQAPLNFTEIDLHDISYDAWTKILTKKMGEKGWDFMSQANSFVGAINEILELQFRSDAVQNLLEEDREFDLVLVEAGMIPALIFPHIYKAPVIQISSLGVTMFLNDIIGIPSHPLLYPTATNQKIYNLTTWDKVSILVTQYRLSRLFGGPLVDAQDRMLKDVFGPDIPSLYELINKVDMMFLNSHPVWEGNFPVPPNVIHIWGIHKRVEKELPEELQSYLDSSQNGVIYMSFGTNYFPSMLPAEKIQAFVKVFSELPYDVLWKWDKDELPGRSDNIRIGKWFPQSDLLRHPKLKLFITQGGLQSTDEAIYAGVPLVGVPVMADQWYNVEKYVHFRVGRKLDMETLTVEDVRNVINDVLTDDSYRQNMVRLRSVMRDEPQPALERAVWWTEHVLRHKGAGHLRSPAANLSWAEYYEIPLVSTVLMGLVIACLAVLFTVRLLLKAVLKPRAKVKNN